MFKKIATVAVLALSSSAALAQMRHGGPFEHADANDDGMITREEFTAARAEQFTRMDRNTDGFLDDADSAKRAAKGERRAAMRARLDTDDDGKISKEEFVAGPTPLFDRADKDGSGVLDAEEIESAKAAAKERARERRTR